MSTPKIHHRGRDTRAQCPKSHFPTGSYVYTRNIPSGYKTPMPSHTQVSVCVYLYIRARAKASAYKVLGIITSLAPLTLSLPLVQTSRGRHSVVAVQPRGHPCLVQGRTNRERADASLLASARDTSDRLPSVLLRLTAGLLVCLIPGRSSRARAHVCVCVCVEAYP